MKLLTTTVYAIAFGCMLTAQTPVTDSKRQETLGLIKALNDNKKQQLSDWNGTEEDKLVVMAAMEKAFGDNSGIELYRPLFPPSNWPEITDLVEIYAKGLQDRPEFNAVRIHLSSAREREGVIQTYGSMISERQNKIEAKGNLTLIDYASIASSLVNQGMEMRMSQIDETAQRTSLRAIQQARKNDLMEQRAELKSLDRIK